MKTADEWAGSIDVKDGCYSWVGRLCRCGSGPCDDFLPVIRAVMAEARAAGREEMRSESVSAAVSEYLVGGDGPITNPGDEAYDRAVSDVIDAIRALK